MLQEDLYKKILSGLAFKRWELNCLDVALFFKQELYTTSVWVPSLGLTEGLCWLVYTPRTQLGEISTDSLAGSSLTCFPTDCCCICCCCFCCHPSPYGARCSICSLIDTSLNETTGC